MLVTGPTGSGKSTTLACLVQQLNAQQRLHIVTLEDPIEYLHTSGQCLIHQREIHRHTASFEQGLRSALREDPDVLLIGDYNSYAKEDPITTLTGSGFTNLVSSAIGVDAYSYVFDGQWGYLDHAIGSASLAAQVAGGDERIIGIMVESHLVAGRQDLVPGRGLTYGQSITDGCIDWDSSVQVLENLAASVRQRRLHSEKE